MSGEVAESLREMASNLLAIANRLDGIDVSADAMRSGAATPEQAQAYLDDLLRTHRPDLAPGPPEPEAVSVKVMTGRGFGVYVHRDPITPLQIGDCAWPDGPCDGHRTGLGGMPLLTVPDDQAVHVPHMHPGFKGACPEIVCHATGGRPCRFCGGAPCRITPVERSA